MNTEEIQRKITEERRSRLKTLIDNHGYDAVSKASGVKVSSIEVYLRDKNSMSERSLKQAEYVLNNQ